MLRKSSYHFSIDPAAFTVGCWAPSFVDNQNYLIDTWQVGFWIRKAIHTYIHNWSLQPFSQDYDLVSHATYVVCVNFYT